MMSVHECVRKILQSLPVIAACGAFMAIGPTLILLNKDVMEAQDFPYPICVSNFGVIGSVIFSYGLVRFGIITPKKQEGVEGKNWYKRVLPVGIAHAATLMSGNWVYLYLDVGFIQMIKSFTPVVILLFQASMGVGKPATWSVIFSISIICIGTAITCTFAANYTVTGLILMVVSQSTEALRLVLTQYLLQDLKFDVFESMYRLAPASAASLFVASIIFELPKILTHTSDPLVFILPRIPVFLLCSVLGLGVNLLSFIVIQMTSSLTMKVLSTARNISIVFIGIALYGENVTTNQGIGYSIALIGFGGYNAAVMGACDKKTDRNDLPR
jgi:drug/metabolite transporter (DMT)-like permease